MQRKQKTTVLVLLGAADVVCFALNSSYPDSYWGLAAVVGLLPILFLFEVW